MIKIVQNFCRYLPKPALRPKNTSINYKIAPPNYCYSTHVRANHSSNFSQLLTSRIVYKNSSKKPDNKNPKDPK